MRPLTATELSRMQAAQTASMFDTCNLLPHTSGSTAGTHGYLPESYPSAGSCACGLEMRTSRENLNAEAGWYDARLRLPHGTTITGIDRVQVTYRFGVALATTLTFQVVGPPREGPSGIVLDLKSVV